MLHQDPARVVEPVAWIGFVRLDLDIPSPSALTALAMSSTFGLLIDSFLLTFRPPSLVRLMSKYSGQRTHAFSSSRAMG